MRVRGGDDTNVSVVEEGRRCFAACQITVMSRDGDVLLMLSQGSLCEYECPGAVT